MGLTQGTSSGRSLWNCARNTFQSGRRVASEAALGVAGGAAPEHRVRLRDSKDTALCQGRYVILRGSKRIIGGFQDLLDFIQELRRQHGACHVGLGDLTRFATADAVQHKAALAELFKRATGLWTTESAAEGIAITKNNIDLVGFLQSWATVDTRYRGFKVSQGIQLASGGAAAAAGEYPSSGYRAAMKGLLVVYELTPRLLLGDWATLPKKEPPEKEPPEEDLPETPLILYWRSSSKRALVRAHSLPARLPLHPAANAASCRRLCGPPSR
eukprot:COSAG01_NODE_12560_length_1719_cov_2.003704_2_plen_271_part_00